MADVNYEKRKQTYLKVSDKGTFYPSQPPGANRDQNDVCNKGTRTLLIMASYLLHDRYLSAYRMFDISYDIVTDITLNCNEPFWEVDTPAALMFICIGQFIFYYTEL